MSNPPEWVDDDPEPARPPDERVVTIEHIRLAIETMKASAAIVANSLLRLDELGEPVKRARVRAGNIVDYIEELSQIFRYDIEQQQGKRTADQKIRAERHELS
jgi:hypothetical protein